MVAFSEAMNYETEGRNVRVTSVNPGFVDTEGFPQGDLPEWAVLKMRTVTDAIVRVVREDIAPEYSVPRWAGPLQLFRVVDRPCTVGGEAGPSRPPSRPLEPMTSVRSRRSSSRPAAAGTWSRSTARSRSGSARST